MAYYYKHYLPKWLFCREYVGLFYDIRSGHFFYSYYNWHGNRVCYEYQTNGQWMLLTHLASDLIVGGSHVGICRVALAYFEKCTGHSLFKNMTTAEVEKALEKIESVIVKRIPYGKIFWDTTMAVDWGRGNE